MARYKRNKRPIWIAVPMWSALILILGWGLWQFGQFRQTLLAQAAAAAREQPAPTSADPDPTVALADAPPADQPARQVADTDPWNDATLADAAGGSGNTAVGGSAASTAPPAPTIELDTDEEANALIAHGTALLDDSRVVEGRTALNSALALLDDAPDADPRPVRLRQQLTDLNEGIFLGSAILPEDSAARFIDVRFGDSFLKIGKKYGLSADFLEQINPALNPRNLKPTSGVKIVEGPFHLRLVKHADRLDLYARDWYVRSYTVQLELGNYLPTGTYRIRNAGKIHVGNNLWVAFDGAEPATRDIALGWIYGNAGPRAGYPADDRSTGLKLADTDLQQVYNIVVETRSLLHVEP